MNYSKIYNEIVKRGNARKLKGYKEIHHILPKCIGGNNDKENIVELTAKEHFICHKLLTEIYPNETGLHYASWAMATMKNTHGRKYKVSAGEYQRLKENLVVSKETRNKISKAGIGHVVTIETKMKLHHANIGKTLSENHKQKIRSSTLGRLIKDEIRIKMSKSSIGNLHTKETKEKISLTLIGTKQKIIKCPHCNKQGGNIMKRYHFDNCKTKL